MSTQKTNADSTGGEVEESLNETCKRHLIIWRAEANGQIGRIDEKEGGGKAAQGQVHTKIIGPYAMASKTEKEMECSYRGYASTNRGYRWQHERNRK